MKRGFMFLTVVAVAATLLVGCAQPGAPSPRPSQSSTGTLTVLVTDAPSYEVVNVLVHFLRVEVHKAADGTEGGGQWKEIPLAAPDGQTFDGTYQITLSATMGNVTLAQDQVEAGKYTQIRVYVDEDYENHPVEVTYLQPVDGNTDGESQTVEKTVGAKLPSGKLKFIRPFVVEADTETQILLDFDLQKSVVFTGASQSEDVKVIVKPVVKLQVTKGGDQANVGHLELRQKNPDTWEVVEDGASGMLTYNLSGSTFEFKFEGEGLEPDTEYSLIYYADREDRFVEWGGDNPGALIGSSTSDTDGEIEIEGSVNLREDLDPLGMDLPHPDDANAYYWNYADEGDPNYTGDGYANAHGAKIWLVPSSAYDAGAYRVDSWEPESFLFETDLINFDDTDWEP